MSDTDLEIDNETAVLNEAAAEAEADKVAVAAPPEPAPEPAAPEPAAPDPVLAALAEQAAATRALAEQVAAAQRQPEPAAAEVPARDFAAELAALRSAYDADDSTMTLADYEAQADAIKEARNSLQTQAAINAALAAQEEARKRQAEELADAQWQASYARFSADPGNAAMLADPIKRAGFEAALQLEYQATPGASYDDMLVAARARLTGVPAVDTSKTLRDAAFARQTATPDPAPTLRDIPSAGVQDGSAGAALDALNISDLEDALARMPDADRERFLAEAPGGLRDNPRATS